MNLVDLDMLKAQERARAELVSTIQAELEITNTTLQASEEQLEITIRSMDPEGHWIRIGRRLSEWRKRLGLSRAYVSRETSVGVNRLVRLEQGLPVRDARIITRIYEMVLERQS